MAAFSVFDRNDNGRERERERREGHVLTHHSSKYSDPLFTTTHLLLTLLSLLSDSIGKVSAAEWKQAMSSIGDKLNDGIDLMPPIAPRLQRATHQVVVVPINVALSPTLDEVSYMMADAAPDRDGNIVYRNFVNKIK